MKKTLKKLMGWEPNMWLVALASFLGLLVILIPMLRLALYSTPYYDDYSFGLFVRNFLEEDRSLISAIKGAIYCSKTQWYAWQGTYSASFLNSLMPAVWGDEYYFIGCILLILILPIAVIYFVWTLLRDVLKAGQEYCLIISSLVAIITVAFIYYVQQAFYWYVGGVCYIVMHSLMLVTIALWVKLFTRKVNALSIVRLIIATVLSLIIAGGTYVSALQGLLVGISILAFGLLLKNKRSLLLLPSLVCYIYGLYKNISAPGNLVRGASFDGYSPAKAIVMSFVEGYKHLWKFTGPATMVIIIFVVLITIKMQSNLNYSFKWPGLLLLWSVCLYATGFTPQLFAMGSPGLGRTVNVIKITYQLLLIINVVYLTGWIVRRLKDKKEALTGFKLSAPYYLAVVVLFIFVFAIDKNPVDSFAPYGAYYFVHTGEANNYYQEYLNRVEQIKNGEPDVVVEPYGYRPYYLNEADLSENPNSQPNVYMARWYGKYSITCLPRNE